MGSLGPGHEAGARSSTREPQPATAAESDGSVMRDAPAEDASWDPTPPDEPDPLRAWARSGFDQWRRDEVTAALLPLAAQGDAPVDLRAAALAWVVPGGDEPILTAARALAADTRVPDQSRVYLAAALARELATRDHPDAAAAIDDAARLADAAGDDPTAALAVARTRVDVAVLGTDAGRLRDALGRLVAATAAAALPSWAREVALASRLAGLRRWAEIDASGVDADEVSAAVEAAIATFAGRPAPAAVPALALQEAAILALATARPGDALSLARAALTCGGAEAPPVFRYRVALLAADAAVAAERPAEALVHQRRAITVADELDTGLARGIAHRGMGLLLARLGRPDEADTQLSRASDLLTAAGDAELAAETSIQLGRHRLEEDDTDGARKAVQAAIDALDPVVASAGPGDPTAARVAEMLCEALAARSEVDDLEGDHRAAVRGWLSAAERAGDAGRCGAVYRAAAARSLGMAGRHEQARAEFVRAIGEADRLDAPDVERARVRGAVLEARATWHLDAGRPAEAADDAGESVATHDLSGDRAAAVRTGLVLGHALVADGKPLAAEAAWRTALATASTAADPAAHVMARVVHAELADLLDRLGHSQEAAKHRRSATSPATDGVPDGHVATVGDDGDAEAASKLAAARAAAARAEQAAHPDTDRDTLAALAADPLAAVRAAVAGRDDISPALAHRLARDAETDVATALAGNPGSPRGAIRRAARWRAAPDVHRAAAGNPNAGARLLARLAFARRWDVRRCVAANPAAPRWLVLWLARDRVWSVRDAVAASSRCPAFVLWLGARARVAPIRFAVAGNVSAPSHVVERLLDDRDVYVSGRAAGHPAVPGAVLAARFGELTAPAWVLRRVAANPTCPPDLAERALTWLALGGAEGGAEFDPVTCNGHPGDPEVNEWQWYAAEARQSPRPWRHVLWRVRAASMDARSSIDRKLVLQLARDPVPQVRQVALWFSGLGQPVYRELTGDADPVVRRTAPRLLDSQRARDRAAGHPAGEGTARNVFAAAVAVVVVGSVLSLLRTDDRDPRDNAPSIAVPRGAPFVLPVAPVADLAGDGQVTVGRAFGSHDDLIVVRVMAWREQVLIHDVQVEPTTVVSPPPNLDVPQEVREGQHVDLRVTDQATLVRVRVEVAGESETLDFEVDRELLASLDMSMEDLP